MGHARGIAGRARRSSRAPPGAPPRSRLVGRCCSFTSVRPRSRARRWPRCASLVTRGRAADLDERVVHGVVTHRCHLVEEARGGMYERLSRVAPRATQRGVRPPLVCACACMHMSAIPLCRLFRLHSRQSVVNAVLVDGKTAAFRVIDELKHVCARMCVRGRRVPHATWWCRLYGATRQVN